MQLGHRLHNEPLHHVIGGVDVDVSDVLMFHPFAQGKATMFKLSVLDEKKIQNRMREGGNKNWTNFCKR